VLAEATGTDVSAVPGSGAAGGTAAAALATLDAALAPGAGLIADLVGLDGALGVADVVITGEGRLDRQSALGKGSADVAARARAVGVPALAVCGRIDLEPRELVAAGFAGWSDCVSLAGTDARAVERAGPLVAEATAAALDGWLRSR
jgi:glycerate kinase